MKSWIDLETRFNALVELLGPLRMDAQWGSAGEHWHITGMQSNHYVKEFKALASIAGQLLEQSLTPESALGKVLLAENNPEIRWYRAIKEFSGDFRTELPGKEIGENGEILGYIHFGSTSGVVKSSANFCLWLQGNFPVKDSRSWPERIYDDYGKQIVVGTILAVITAILGWAIA